MSHAGHLEPLAPAITVLPGMASTFAELLLLEGSTTGCKQ